MKKIVKGITCFTLMIFITILGMLYSITEVQAASVKISQEKITLTIGKSVYLKIQNTTKTVTWSSDKEKVAKVSKTGKVTAVKEGTAVITAKVDKKAYTCKVTVKKSQKTAKSLVTFSDSIIILTKDKKGTNYFGDVLNYGKWCDTDTFVEENPAVKKGTGWSFDPTTLTLTLDNLVSTRIRLDGFENGITVKLIGKNIVTLGEAGADHAFRGSKIVTFTGDGTLTLALDDIGFGETQREYRGWYSEGDITLEGSCTLDATGIAAGIKCNRLTVGENCTVIGRAVGSLTQSCGIIANGIHVNGTLIAIAEKENLNSFTKEEYPNKGIASDLGTSSDVTNTFGANVVMMIGDTEDVATETSISGFIASYPVDRYVKITK